MEYKDYYKTLGVDRNADEKEIKRAFRRLARKYHPDVNPGDAAAEEQFKAVNEAYEVLSDSEKRAKYDQLGSAYHDWARQGGRPGDFDWGQWTGGAPGPQGQRVHVRYGTPEDLQDLFGGGGSAFSDFFSQIFAGMGGQRGQQGFDFGGRAQDGQSYEQEVQITLEEAYHGATRVLQKDGRRLEVQIPAGARSGTKVRMAGEGAPGAAGGQAGDLYLRVEVLPDARFERQNDDLYVTVPVDLYTAILGGQVQVPTLSGPVVLTIPSGTQNGRTFRLRGKGMPRLRHRSQYGDLLAKVEVQLPARLGPRERELFEELRRVSREGGERP
ncbi:MAG: J domain-containing protein [Anaerolineales bacterium]|nr:J domain-containing protein [Anaerolineales bacterium]